MVEKGFPVFPQAHPLGRFQKTVTNIKRCSALCQPRGEAGKDRENWHSLRKEGKEYTQTHTRTSTSDSKDTTDAQTPEPKQKYNTTCISPVLHLRIYMRNNCTRQHVHLPNRGNKHDANTSCSDSSHYQNNGTTTIDIQSPTTSSERTRKLSIPSCMPNSKRADTC